MALSPQKEKIVSILRDMRWHCGREWLDGIKDDRKRISELNEDYMASKGYRIAGEPCKGRACGKRDCPLHMRRAQKIAGPSPEALQVAKESIEWYERVEQERQTA